MRRYRRPLTAVYLAALAAALGTHDATGRWYAARRGRVRGVGARHHRHRHPPGRNPVTTAARITLTAVTLTLIALLVLFAAAYAVTGDFRYVAAGIACGLFAYCAAEPVKVSRSGGAMES